MTTEGLDLDEVGPPPIEHAASLADIVRKVNSAGVALDQVVVLGGEDAVWLDWSKNWVGDRELTEEERALPRDEVLRRYEADAEEATAKEAEREAEQDRLDAVASDPLEGW